MKLRNKSNGEILEIKLIQTNCECLAEHEVETLYGEKLSLETLNKYYEDYAPAEPLIKDEKIRKVVRLWSSVNGDTKVFYCRSTNQICVFDNEGYVVRSIRFKLEFREDMGLEDGYYTVAELCGEEKE